MSAITSVEKIRYLAGLELNFLLFGQHIPKNVFDGARITSAGTRIYDLNGEILFNRVPIRKGRGVVGYADVAVNPELGHPLLAVGQGSVWNERGLRAEAVRQAKKLQRRIRFNKMRFVAYSYPKLAMQFLQGQEETLMLELFSWKPVPPARKRRRNEPPGYFERWSMLDEIPKAKRSRNATKFHKRLDAWEDLCPPRRRWRKFVPEIMRIQEFKGILDKIEFVPLIYKRELHYSPEDADHSICYELRSQITNVWCVAASVQMVLTFYRYIYEQTRIAADLGLGTLTNPNGLPYANDEDVVTVLQDLTGNALNANMTTSPTWAEFVTEIGANRPLISFVPSHSRTVAGYTRGPSVFGGWFSGLLVYDPWPPSSATPVSPMDGGAITRWENFDATTYRRTFTAKLNLY